MLTAEVKAQIERDITEAVTLPFREFIGYLAWYTHRWNDEIRRGEVTREEIRRYADAVLTRIREAEQKEKDAQS